MFWFHECGMGERYKAVAVASAAGIDFLVANSFSKNLSLYNERTGVLTIVSPTAAEALKAKYVPLRGSCYQGNLAGIFCFNLTLIIY